MSKLKCEKRLVTCQHCGKKIEGAWPVDLKVICCKHCGRDTVRTNREAKVR